MFLDLWNLLFQLSGIPLLLSFFLFAIKVPILLSTMENLRQRGDTIQLPGYGGFPSMGGAGAGYNQAEQGQGQGQAGELQLYLESRNGSGLTVMDNADAMTAWNMPGGFGGAPAGQPASAPAPPAQFPSSGGFRLGDESESPPSGAGAGPGSGGKGPQPGRGGYQTID